MRTLQFRLAHDARTDVGAVRKVNEDSFVARPEAGLWAVADGMGGFENGQWASGVVAERLAAVQVADDFETTALRVADAIHAANDAIHREVVARGRDMGSTAAALLIQGERFAVFWAGDSRVYLLRGGELIRMTTDHTQVQDMVQRGLLTPEQAVGHPMSHVVSRAVGVEPTLELDAVADEAELDDVFLLCSDGLHGVASDEEIARALTSAPKTAAQDLVALCLSRGAPDNVTVVTVSCEEPTLLWVGPDRAEAVAGRDKPAPADDEAAGRLK